MQNHRLLPRISPEEERLIEPFYKDLAQAFAVDLTRMDPTLDAIDEEIHPGQFRQFIQQEGITAQCLKALAMRFVAKSERTESDWDKLFLLLTQYCCIVDPKILYGSAAVAYPEVTRVLAPIFGRVTIDPPENIAMELEPLQKCKRLADAEEMRVLERSRRIKKIATSSGTAETLVLVTHFNLSVRKTFLRLLHLELAAIYDLLGRLESRGTRTFDGSSAGMSSNEPLSRVREVCLKWTSPARVSFGTGDQFSEIIAIHRALDMQSATIPLSPVEQAHQAAIEEKLDPVQDWIREAMRKIPQSRFHVDVGDCAVCFTPEEVKLLMTNTANESEPVQRAITLRLLLTLIVEGKVPKDRGFTPEQSYATAVEEATALAAYLEKRDDAAGQDRYRALADELFSLMVDARERIGFEVDA